MGVTTDGINLVVGEGVTTLSDLTKINTHVKNLNNALFVVTDRADYLMNGGFIFGRGITTSSHLNLEGTNTYHFQYFKTESNAYLNSSVNIKGCKLVFGNGNGASEHAAPLIGNELTTVLFKAGGQGWNSRSPLVNLKNSTYIYEMGFDFHVIKHQDAVVDGVRIFFKSKTPNAVGLRMYPNMSASKVLNELPNLEFNSTDGNHLIGFLHHNGGSYVGANSGYFVAKDYKINIAPVGEQTKHIPINTRAANANISICYPKSINVRICYLWIDPYTTLNETGQFTDVKKYLNTVKYTSTTTNDTLTSFDVIVNRWTPRFIGSDGLSLKDGYCVVTCNSNMNDTSNVIGDRSLLINSKLLTIGVIKDGSFDNHTSLKWGVPKETIIAEADKYSFVHFQQDNNDAYRIYTEPKTKYIPCFSSETTVGHVDGNKFSGSEFSNPQIIIRSKGHIFFKRNLNIVNPELNEGRLVGPLAEDIQLTEDTNYTLGYKEADKDLVSILVTKEKCTVSLKSGRISLDAIYNSIIDTYVPLAEDNISLPITQNNKGVLELLDNVEFVTENDTVVVKGVKVDSIIVTKDIDFNIENITVKHKTKGNYINVLSDEPMNLLAHVYQLNEEMQPQLISEVHLEDVKTGVVLVPDNSILRLAAWSLGKAGYYKELVINKPVVHEIDWVDYSNGILDVNINVDDILSNCELSLSNDGVTLALPAGTYNSEVSKILLHYIVGTKIGLTATIGGGNTIASRIDKDRYVIFLPLFKLIKKKDLTARDVCCSELYIDVANAKDLNSGYVVNPVMDNGRVEIPSYPSALNPEDVSRRTLRDLMKHPQFISTTVHNMSSDILK